MTTQTGHTNAIRAKKVLGTSVKDKAGHKIGDVEDIVLDKLDNRIMFVIVSFGGFLGIAEKYHPIPWSALDFDPIAASYVVNFTKEQLQAAPADNLEALTKGDGYGFRNRVYDYYQTPRYWS
jgi:sporulation protein YlmC with PRC-barrel domain